MRTQWILWLMLGACARDASTLVNVAPSAEHKLDDIAEAVERLNQEVGEETFALRAVNSEERIDGEVIVRAARDLGEANAHEVRIGNTKRTHEGVIVRIAFRATPSAIAHELGHAAGLGHVSDENNLMFRETAPNRWALTPDQRTRLRGMF